MTTIIRLATKKEAICAAGILRSRYGTSPYLLRKEATKKWFENSGRELKWAMNVDKEISRDDRDEILFEAYWTATYLTEAA